MKDNFEGVSPALREDAERLDRLRQDPNAVQAIMLQLLAQKMGPADYLKTKREVQLFVEKGDVSEGIRLLERAAARREGEVERMMVAEKRNLSP